MTSLHIFTCAVLAVSSAAAAGADGKGDDVVVRLKLPAAELDALERSGVDVWHRAPAAPRAGGDAASSTERTLIADVHVPASRLNESLFAGAETLIANVAGAIRDERARVEARGKASSNWTAARGDDSFFDTFRPYAEHVRYHVALAEEFSDVITLQPVIGETIEGRRIDIIKISGPEKSPGKAAASGNSSESGGRKKTWQKPVVYLQSTVHAREWLATTSLAWTMKALAEGYGTDPTITFLLDTLDFYVVPVVNIDGYVYTWETDRLWRKNRRNNGGGSFGVDINRNWGPASTWCSSGSSSNPSSDTYCGTFAFSEPETAAAGAFVDSHPVVAAVDFHTYGPLLLWPWQYTYDRVPQPDLRDFELLGAAMVNAMDIEGQRFVSQPGSDLYPHSGGLVDYCYGEYGTKAFTFEGRGSSFIVPDSDIVPAGVEQFQGVVVMSEYVAIIEKRKAAERAEQ